MARPALILFAHGARDPRWAAPFERLQQLSQAQLPDVDVSLAFLELMSPRLPETVAALVQGGCEELTVVPVFLGQGGHVLRDLPELMTQMALDHPALRIKVAEAVGENAEVLGAISRYCVSTVA
ncbi:MAG: CbiX/SirB N-terminal domain-containing protein [Herminiimonas sp.]|nr:CbiX/SirB N-terminal domain-containing protein [Herminiimonas sp.]